MKTRIDIPDNLFRRAKGRAPKRGQPLHELVTEALHEKLAVPPTSRAPTQPRWMEGFGKLRRLRKETSRIEARIEAAFEVVEPAE